MTVDLCTKHCCKSPDTDAVFLLNSHCFCVKCYSVRSCSLQKITPPPGYIPVTVIVMESISKFSTTSTPHTHPKTFREIPKTETSSQSTAVRLNQKQTEQGTERHSHVKTTPTQTTSYGGPGRGTGEDQEIISFILSEAQSSNSSSCSIRCLFLSRWPCWSSSLFSLRY